VAFWPKSLLGDSSSLSHSTAFLTLSKESSPHHRHENSTMDEQCSLLLVGWRTVKTISQKQSSRISVTTVVVACVAVPRQSSMERDYKDKVNQALLHLNQKWRSAQNESFATTNKADSDDASNETQAASHRRHVRRERALCFGVGCRTDESDDHNNDDLRVLGRINMTGRNTTEEWLLEEYPWYPSSNAPTKETNEDPPSRRQLVIYNDSLDHTYCTSHQCADWLIRIDNAPMVQLALQHTGQPFVSKGQQSITHRESVQHPQSVVSLSTRGGRETTISHFIDYIQTQHQLSWPLPRRIASLLSAGNTIGRTRDEGVYPIMTKQSYIHQNVEYVESQFIEWFNLGLGFVCVLMVLSMLVVWMQRSNSSISGHQLETPLDAAVLLTSHVLKWHFKKLRHIFSWLTDNPLGIKVNAPLATSMSVCATELLDRVESIWLSLLRHAGDAVGAVHVTIPTKLSVAIQVLTCLFVTLFVGFAGLLALACDVWLLATWHVDVITDAMGVLVKVELYILEATWRMFRGKKRNVLRHDRTDTLFYDSTQLLFGGSILFAIALFLGSTLFIYFVVWTCIYYLSVVLVHEGSQRLLAQFKKQGTGRDIVTGKSTSRLCALAHWFLRWYQKKRWFPKSHYLIPSMIQLQPQLSADDTVELTSLETVG